MQLSALLLWPPSAGQVSSPNFPHNFLIIGSDWWDVETKTVVFITCVGDNSICCNSAGRHGIKSLLLQLWGNIGFPTAKVLDSKRFYYPGLPRSSKAAASTPCVLGIHTKAEECLAVMCVKGCFISQWRMDPVSSASCIFGIVFPSAIIGTQS